MTAYCSLAISGLAELRTKFDREQEDVLELRASAGMYTHLDGTPYTDIRLRE